MKRRAYLLQLFSLMLLLIACSSRTDESTSSQDLSPTLKGQTDINSLHLRDNDLLYTQDEDTSVVTMYLTVRKGNAAENTDHTWQEINSYSAYHYDRLGIDRYQVAGLLQVGNADGPQPGEVGYGEMTPNATVQVRGQTSSRNQQKNYKIELKRNKGLWKEQRTINLNKHQTDGLRFRNKLAFDLLEGIPQLMSLRTQFVHLYVKDETGDQPGEFVDYGLYTQVEQLNRTALRSHGLDSNAHLYKVNFFEFYLYDSIKLETDPTFNLAAFEEHLEVKGERDHTKLIDLLKLINDTSYPTETLLEKYLDKENILYWMAFQILIGNTDTQNRNFYLYSPQNSQTWYIIPWDHDGAFVDEEYLIEKFSGKSSWEQGISNYWGSALFQRLLKHDPFRNELKVVIEELRSYLSEQRLTQMVNGYLSVTKPYVSRMPDMLFLGFTPEQYDQVAAGVAKQVEDNYQKFLASYEKPMPFFITVPEARQNRLHLSWGSSYDFDSEDVSYTVEVAKDYAFNEVIFKQGELRLTETSMDILPKGQYFVRVSATNASGHTQDAFDYYVTDSGKQFGMMSFYVLENGVIQEDVYIE